MSTRRSTILSLQTNEHKKHHDVYSGGNLDPVLGQTLECDGVKSVYGLREARINTAYGTSFNSNILILRNMSILYIQTSKLSD